MGERSRNRRRLGCALVAAIPLLLVALGFLPPLISTKRKIHSAREQLEKANTLAEVRSALGKDPTREWTSHDIPAWLLEKIDRPVAPADHLYAFNFEGLPYWFVRVLVNEDGEVLWWSLDLSRPLRSSTLEVQRPTSPRLAWRKGKRSSRLVQGPGVSTHHIRTAMGS